MKINQITFSEVFKKEVLSAAGKIVSGADDPQGLPPPFDSYVVSLDGAWAGNKVLSLDGESGKIFVFLKKA